MGSNSNASQARLVTQGHGDQERMVNGRDHTLLEDYSNYITVADYFIGDFRPSVPKYLLFQDKTSLDAYVKFLNF